MCVKWRKESRRTQRMKFKRKEFPRKGVAIVTSVMLYKSALVAYVGLQLDCCWFYWSVLSAP